MTVCRIDQWADIPGVLRQMRAVGAHHRALLLQALYDGEIAHLEIQRGTSSTFFKQFAARASGRPAVLLAGDDDVASTGPNGWPLARRVLRWSRHIIIDGAGADLSNYRMAIGLAQLLGNVAYIETSSEQAQAWKDAALAVPLPPSIFMVLPRSGPHPLPGAGGLN